MKLSAEQFSQTLVALGCGDAATAHENRAHGRVPMGTKATIIPCGENGRGEVMTVVVLNISESGVGVLIGVPMRAGDSFILRIPATVHTASSGVLCSVVHVQTVSPTQYAVGARFNRVLVVKQDQPAEASPITELPDGAEQDIDHVREVESRLRQLNF